MKKSVIEAISDIERAKMLLEKAQETLALEDKGSVLHDAVAYVLEVLYQDCIVPTKAIISTGNNQP